MKSILRKIISRCAYFFRSVKYKRCFAEFGKHSDIIRPLRINGSKNIFIGNGVSVHKQAWLGAKNLTGSIPVLRIDDGAVIGDYAHIFATSRIHIGENVLIANFVYIADNVHGYEDIDTPIKQQSIIQKNDVFIGSGSWIGEHVSIIGASIGKHCVIGANSVVTKDIPSYSVAVGCPARVIKRYNTILKVWEKVES